MQNKLTKGPLLDNKGNLVEAGYSFRMDRSYRRKQIKGLKTRIKEWDYYYVGNNEHGVAFTIADNSLYSLGSISILDFKKKSYITESRMKFFTFGKTKLPSDSSAGDITWRNKQFYLHFVNSDKKRTIDIIAVNYHQNKPFEAHFELEEIMDDSMVIATPFNKKKHFYYNEKKNCMKAKGYYLYNGEKIEFSDDNTRAILDWGRGVWTYKNTWYWSGLSSVQDGVEIGFNLGYGFGDTSKASENMLFYDKKAYKLLDVKFEIPQDDAGNYEYLKPWKIVSQNKDINLEFTPLFDRKDITNLLVLKSFQHQVFGIFNGTIKAEDIVVKFENIVSFAEMVTNYW